MDDERLIAMLRSGVDRPVDPSTAFGTALFERLVVVSGLRGGRGRPWSTPMPTLRLALVVLAVIVALTAAALVGGRLVGPSPLELVERSRVLYARPPAFQAVVVLVAPGEGGSHTVSSDGNGTWRVDIDETLEFATGVSVIWSAADGGAAWDPNHEAWRPLPADDPPPFPLQTEIVWGAVPVPAASPAETTSWGIPGNLTCPDWSEIGEEVVASRPAIRLHCGERDQDFWLDRETLLVLQVRAGAATPGWDNGAGISIAELKFGSLDPALFIASPVADRPEDWPAAVFVGQPIPAWSGVTLDGAPVGSDRTAGRPQVILVWASWCPPCFEDVLPFLRSVTGRTDVDVVTIAINDDPVLVRAALATAGFAVSTVVDDGAIQEAFGAYTVPTLILVDAAGVVQAFAVAPVDPGVLGRAVDTLVAGGTPILSSPSP